MPGPTSLKCLLMPVRFCMLTAGTHENLRHTVMAKRIGLHSIAEALNEHHQSYSPSGPESRSPLMASTPTTGRKMFRTMSPLTRQTDGQELFETAGPLSPVTGKAKGSQPLVHDCS